MTEPTKFTDKVSSFFTDMRTTMAKTIGKMKLKTTDAKEKEVKVEKENSIHLAAKVKKTLNDSKAACQGFFKEALLVNMPSIAKSFNSKLRNIGIIKNTTAKASKTDKITKANLTATKESEKTHAREPLHEAFTKQFMDSLPDEIRKKMENKTGGQSNLDVLNMVNKEFNRGSGLAPEEIVENIKKKFDKYLKKEVKEVRVNAASAPAVRAALKILNIEIACRGLKTKIPGSNWSFDNDKGKFSGQIFIPEGQDAKQLLKEKLGENVKIESQQNSIVTCSMDPYDARQIMRPGRPWSHLGIDAALVNWGEKTHSFKSWTWEPANMQFSSTLESKDVHAAPGKDIKTTVIDTLKARYNTEYPGLGDLLVFTSEDKGGNNLNTTCTISYNRAHAAMDNEMPFP